MDDEAMTPTSPATPTGAEVLQKHDPSTGPCPACGFHLIRKEPVPFVLDDDASEPIPSPPANGGEA